MSSLPIFGIIKETQIKKVDVVFPGGFRGVVDERFQDYISSTLTLALERLQEDHPEKVFENCPANLKIEGMLTVETEKVWTNRRLIFTSVQYEAIQEAVSTKEIILPWEPKPGRSIPIELVDESGWWYGDVSEFINDLTCAKITDISTETDAVRGDLYVLRDFDAAIRRFRPKVLAKFNVTKIITNPANGKSIDWVCKDSHLITRSLFDYCWQVKENGECTQFAGFDNFQEVLKAIES